VPGASAPCTNENADSRVGVFDWTFSVKKSLASRRTVG
jgi:hypothetical protein